MTNGNTCQTCGLLTSTIDAVERCGLKRHRAPGEDCVHAELAAGKRLHLAMTSLEERDERSERYRVTYTHRDGSVIVHEHLHVNELPDVGLRQEWRTIKSAMIELEELEDERPHLTPEPELK